jgi:acyl carrier protein
MATTFGCDEADLSIDTDQENFSRWSSLYHMTLMVAIEERFGVHLSMDDMLTMTSTRRILEVLQRAPELARA